MADRAPRPHFADPLAGPALADILLATTAVLFLVLFALGPTLSRQGETRREATDPFAVEPFLEPGAADRPFDALDGLVLLAGPNGLRIAGSARTIAPRALADDPNLAMALSGNSVVNLIIAANGGETAFHTKLFLAGRGIANLRTARLAPSCLRVSLIEHDEVVCEGID